MISAFTAPRSYSTRLRPSLCRARAQRQARAQLSRFSPPPKHDPLPTATARARTRPLTPGAAYSAPPHPLWPQVYGENVTRAGRGWTRLPHPPTGCGGPNPGTWVPAVSPFLGEVGRVPPAEHSTQKLPQSLPLPPLQCRRRRARQGANRRRVACLSRALIGQ